MDDGQTQDSVADDGQIVTCIIRMNSKGGSNPEILSPAGMSCVRTEDNAVFVAEEGTLQKLVGKRS